MEDVNIHHTPWLTICPNPGVHFANLERLYQEYMNLSPKPEIRKLLPAFGMEPVDFAVLAHLASQTGRDLGSLVGQVLLSPLSHLVCTVVPTAATNEPGTARYPRSCHPDFYEPPGERIHEYSSFYSQQNCIRIFSLFQTHHSDFSGDVSKMFNGSSMMVRETKAGLWDTKLIPFWYADDAAGEARLKLKFCSTFMPNTTINPDTVDRIELDLALDPRFVYAHENRYECVAHSK